MFFRRPTSKYTNEDTNLTATESGNYIPMPVSTRMVLSKNGHVMCKSATGDSESLIKMPRTTEQHRISIFKTQNSHDDPMRSRNSISETKRFQNLKQVTTFETKQLISKIIKKIKFQSTRMLIAIILLFLLTEIPAALVWI